MRRRRRPTQDLSRAAADCLEALHALGRSELTTRQVAARVERRVESVTFNLETLERNGLVTSSLSTDGLERHWSLANAKHSVTP